MPSESKKMYDEHFQPKSPLDDIPDLEPMSPEEEKRILDRHERVVLPEILQREHERVEAVHKLRKVVLF